ncbi:MAG: phosphoglucosamine mutase, partial [Eggerthellaceae bacterium]|nr:phosphoglucosamine mutase [Eggerthellaceae bacterium]
FDREGYKLPVDLEHRIEAFVGEGGIPADELPGGDEVGTVMPVDDAVEIYIEHAVDTVRSQGIDFSSWRIALDVAHGAAAVASAEALRRLGAEVVVINEDYCGTDINVKCGSTYLEPLRQLVCKTRAHVGIAHDGDADRVLFVDAHGNDIDGDMVEAACAIDLKKRGLLRGDTVVSTVMCNLGFVHAMREAGIEVEQTAVGDRHVLERMREGGYVLGGEQSGHTIFLDYNTTGDGLVTACQFLAAITRGDSTAQTAAAAMMRFPQELINVRVTDKDAVAGNVAIHKAIVAAEEEMGESGRVLVRASGTEPLIRVMVEAASAEEAKRHATAIADVVTAELGA